MIDVEFATFHWLFYNFAIIGGVFIRRKYSTPLKLIGYLRRVGWFAKLPANIIVEHAVPLQPSTILWKNLNPP